MKVAILTILLQGGDILEHLLKTGAAGQAFSTVLLLTFGIFMVRKQNELQTRLDNYIREDREEMEQVIKQNTNAYIQFMQSLADLISLSKHGTNRTK